MRLLNNMCICCTPMVVVCFFGVGHFRVDCKLVVQQKVQNFNPRSQSRRGLNTRQDHNYVYIMSFDLWLMNFALVNGQSTCNPLVLPLAPRAPTSAVLQCD